MELPLKTNKLLSLFLIVLLLSCSPTGLIKDSSGYKTVIKKIESTDKDLLFRREGIEVQLSLGSIGFLYVFPETTEVYAGDTWVRSAITNKKDTTNTKVYGWILSSDEIKGEAAVGPVIYPLTSISMIDFIMAEEPASHDTTQASDSTTISDSTQSDTTVTK